MRRYYSPQSLLRPVALAAAGLWAAFGLNLAQAACTNTRAEAAAGLHATAGQGGFRVTSTRWDPVLHQRWAQIASCAHPEWPTVELPAGISLQSSLSQSSQQPGADSLLPLLPVVHAGDIVQLWSQEDDLRIEVAAIAEQSGALGQPVRVRLMQRATLGQQMEEQFNGVVRGPHDVEMQR